MARLAEFIGGTQFEGRRSIPNERDNRRDEGISLDGRTVPNISIIRHTNSGNTPSRNEEQYLEVGEQRSNPISEFRVSSFCDISDRARNSSSNNSIPGSGKQNTAAPEEQKIELLTRPASTSSLADIIQLLGSVARSGSRRNLSVNNVVGTTLAVDNIVAGNCSGPTSQAEGPRVPPTGKSDSFVPSTSSRVPLWSANDDSTSSSSEDEDTEAESRRQPRSQLEKQGFILLPPDPRNPGVSASIVYFGGSGLTERGAVPDTIARESYDNLQSNSSSASSRTNSTASASTANVGSTTFR